MSDHGTEPAHLLLLGQIDGRLEGLQQQLAAQSGMLEKMDGRLRNQEVKSASYGALGGIAASVGIALIVESVKGWIKGNPHT